MALATRCDGESFQLFPQTTGAANEHPPVCNHATRRAAISAASSSAARLAPIDAIPWPAMS